MLLHTISRAIPIALVCLLVGMAIASFREAKHPAVNLDPVMMSQMETIASQRGMSVEEAAYRYGWQNDFSMMVDRIREASPNSVTTSEIAGDRQGLVSFAGAVPPTAEGEVTTFQSLHVGVAVELRPNQGYSERDLDQAMEAVHYGLLNQPEVENAITSFSSGTITSRVLLSDGAPPGILDKLRVIATEKLTQSEAKLSDYVSVQVGVMKPEDAGGLENDSAHLGGSCQLAQSPHCGPHS